MIRFRRITLPLLAAAFPLGCNARDPVKHEFECDTPAGHRSYWSRSVNSKEIEISGKVALAEERDHERWLPVAFIVLRDDDDRDKGYGIRLYVSRKTPNAINMDLRKLGGHIDIGTGSISNSSRPIPFSLKLDASGLLQAKVAGKEASTMLGAFVPKAVELSCSTAEFHFTDIKVTEK